MPLSFLPRSGCAARRDGQPAEGLPLKRVGRRYGMVIVLAVVVGTAASGAWRLVSTPVLGGAQADAFPEGWRDVPLQAFIDHSRQTLQVQPPVAAEVVAAMREQAAERLRHR